MRHLENLICVKIAGPEANRPTGRTSCSCLSKASLCMSARQCPLHHWISYGTSVLFQCSQRSSAKNIKSFKFVGSWLAICIVHFVNWTMEIRRYYEKRKSYNFGRVFFVTATLGPLSGCKNLIWNQCTTFCFCTFEFLSHRRLILVL